MVSPRLNCRASQHRGQGNNELAGLRPEAGSKRDRYLVFPKRTRVLAVLAFFDKIAGTLIIRSFKDHDERRWRADGSKVSQFYGFLTSVLVELHNCRKKSARGLKR